MDVLYIIFPMALVLAGIALAGFSWAAKRGQFDDLETPARRMLHDDFESKEQQADSTPPKNL